MDPNATLEQFQECVMNSDFDGANQCLKDLREWMNRGGFVPKVNGPSLEFLMTYLMDKWMLANSRR